MFRRKPSPSLPPFPRGALLVGGAARDVLRGVPPKDYDWAVPHPRAAAEGLAAELGGTAFALDEERDYWRVSGAGGIQHDLVPLPEHLTDDLWRRDFTVNALALNEQGRVLDPTGGKTDLQRRTLRMVSAANLRSDPLRAWRAVRFEITLGFRLEPHTLKTVHEVASELAGGALPWPAPERIRDEVHALLNHEQAAHGIQRLAELGLLGLTAPELLEGRGVTQGGFHHLDVYGHGLEALHQLLARWPDASVPLRWATLLHDVGKPRTRAQHPETGRISFHGHDKLGADMTKAILERLKLPGADIQQASRLIGAHMLPLPATETEARRFVYRRRELLPELLCLMLADREAARGPSSSEASRYAYAQGIERVLVALEGQPQPPAPLLSGEDIMALLRLQAGPKVGQAVRALAEAQAMGDAWDAVSARAFLVRWAAQEHLN